jgi:hypothetical protein
MSICNGRGRCFKLCGCSCKKEEPCHCGHRDHTPIRSGSLENIMYCQEHCVFPCELLPCRNYRFCMEKHPERILDCQNQMCVACADMAQYLRYTGDKGPCHECKIANGLFELQCKKHRICWFCWHSKIEAKQRANFLACPLCKPQEAWWN